MNIKTIGFELEYFFQTIQGEFAFLPDNLRYLQDGCGYLVEARGDPHHDQLKAKHLLNAASEQLKTSMAKAGFMLQWTDTADVPREHMRLCLRRFGKGPAKSYFASGRVYLSNKPRAGLHVHFGNQEEFRYTDDDESRTFTYVPMMNIGRIVYLMDKAFANEIKAAKRIPGEYELKAWGFEYRSLPATVNIDKVLDVIQTIKQD